LTMHDDELGYEIFAIDDPKQIFYWPCMMMNWAMKYL
jgi:hypothetical protein